FLGPPTRGDRGGGTGRKRTRRPAPERPHHPELPVEDQPAGGRPRGDQEGKPGQVPVDGRKDSGRPGLHEEDASGTPGEDSAGRGSTDPCPVSRRAEGWGGPPAGPPRVFRGPGEATDGGCRATGQGGAFADEAGPRPRITPRRDRSVGRGAKEDRC